MHEGNAAKTPFADTPGGSSYHQISPNCRRTPPAKAPARILHRPHARGVRSHQTKQQKGSKCCQMRQLAGRCARAWMVCHQTQVLGRPHTPRPISSVGQTPWPKSQAVEPTPKPLLDEGKTPTTFALPCPNTTTSATRRTRTTQPHSEFSDRYRARQARAEPVLIYYRAAANAVWWRDVRGVEPRQVCASKREAAKQTRSAAQVQVQTTKLAPVLKFTQRISMGASEAIL